MYPWHFAVDTSGFTNAVAHRVRVIFDDPSVFSAFSNAPPAFPGSLFSIATQTRTASSSASPIGSLFDDHMSAKNLAAPSTTSCTVGSTHSATTAAGSVGIGPPPSVFVVIKSSHVLNPSNVSGPLYTPAMTPFSTMAIVGYCVTPKEMQLYSSQLIVSACGMSLVACANIGANFWQYGHQGT